MIANPSVEDNACSWVEYPKGTWQRPFNREAPDRITFFREGLWGMMTPDGTVIAPAQYQHIVNYRQSGRFIVRDQAGRVCCMDKDFHQLLPWEDDWVSVREKIDEMLKK